MGKQVRGDARAQVARERALEAYLRADGARAAAWVVRHKRSAIRRDGAIEFTLPDGYKMPGWMFVALEFLERRGHTWTVRRFHREGARAWIVAWNPPPAVAACRERRAAS